VHLFEEAHIEKEKGKGKLEKYNKHKGLHKTTTSGKTRRKLQRDLGFQK